MSSTLALDAAMYVDLALMEAAVALALPAQDQQLSALEAVHLAAPPHDPPRVAVDILEATPCVCNETLNVAESTSQPGSLSSPAHKERPDALKDLVLAAEEEQLLHSHALETTPNPISDAFATHMAIVRGVGPGMHQSYESANESAQADLGPAEVSEAELSLHRASTSAADADESLGADSRGVSSVEEHDSRRSEQTDAAMMRASTRASTSELQYAEGSDAASRGILDLPATSVSAQPHLLVSEQATLIQAHMPAATPDAVAAAEPSEPSMHVHLQMTLADTSHAAVLSPAHASPEDGSTALQLPEKLDTDSPPWDAPLQARAVAPAERQDEGVSTSVAPGSEAPGATEGADSAEAGGMVPGTASTALTHERNQSLQHADSPSCKLSSASILGQPQVVGSLDSHCQTEGHSRSGAAANTSQHLQMLEGRESSGGCSDAGHSASSEGQVASSPMQAGNGHSQVSTSGPAVEMRHGDCGGHDSMGDLGTNPAESVLMQELPGVQPWPTAAGSMSHNLRT